MQTLVRSSRCNLSITTAVSFASREHLSSPTALLSPPQLHLVSELPSPIPCPAPLLVPSSPSPPTQRDLCKAFAHPPGALQTPHCGLARPCFSLQSPLSALALDLEYTGLSPAPDRSKPPSPAGSRPSLVSPSPSAGTGSPARRVSEEPRHHSEAHPRVLSAQAPLPAQGVGLCGLTLSKRHLTCTISQVSPACSLPHAHSVQQPSPWFFPPSL